jgi:hypothetical protein
VKTLYTRELRRLAPFALGITAVVLGYASLAPALADAGPVWADFARTASLGILLLPAVLGVATVAPDTSSGGLAFLARLPLSPARALLVKAGAAITWWLPTILLVALAVMGALFVPTGMTPLGEAPGFLWLVTNMTLYATFAFGAGLLASVVAARSLPAVLVTPSLAITGLLLGSGVPYVALRVPMGEVFTAVVCSLLGAAFVGVAFLAYARGDRHRASFRPAMLALGALAPIFLAGFGVTAVAHAWTVERVVPTLAAGPTPGLASPDGAAVAIPLEGEGWTGLEQRVAVVTRADRQAWVAPVRYAVEPQFSPDSTRLVLRHALDPGGWLGDLATHELRELHGAAPTGIGFEDAIWSAEGPFFVRDRGEWLEGFDPLQPCDYDPELSPPATVGVQRFDEAWTYLGVRGQALVFSHPQQGLVEATPQRGQGNPCPLRVDLNRATPLASWPQGTTPQVVLLSPDSQHALVLPRDQRGESTLLLVDLRDGAHAWLHTGFDGVRLEETRVSWSPGQKYVAVEYPNGRIGVFELSSGASRAELASSRPNSEDPRTTARVYRHGPVVWSPTGARLATPAGLLVELEDVSADAADTRPLVPFDADRHGGDRYFVTNHEGVVFYTSAAELELNEGTDCEASELPLPVDFMGWSDSDSGSDSESGSAAESTLDSRFTPRPEISTDLQLVPPTAAFLDGRTVIPLFEPLSLSSLAGGAPATLLKGGE